MAARRPYAQQLAHRGLPRSSAPESEFAPPVVGSTVACWWATDIDLYNLDPVGSWIDRINFWNQSQTLTVRPTYLAAGLAGRPTVDFNGSTQCTRYAAVNAVSTASLGCVVVVLQPDALTANTVPWCSADEAVADRMIDGQVRALDRIGMQQRNADTDCVVDGTTTTMIVDTPYALEWSSTGTAWEVRVNNVVQSKTVIAGSDNGDWFGDTTSRDNFTIGAMQRSTTVAFFDGKISLVLVADAQLSADDRVLLYRWIADYYGIV